jgi:hypothetical protein
MRILPWMAAAAVAAASCAAPSAAAPEGRPPVGWGLDTRIVVQRDGADFAAESRTVWRGHEQRFEILGPAPAAGDVGHGLEVGLTADANLGGEFWGEIWLAEFDLLPDGGRADYLGIPHRFALGTSTAGFWELDLPAREGGYRIRVELDHDFWTRAELRRPRFLHRLKFQR